MHLNKAQILIRVALECSDSIERARQARLLHGLLHRDAICIHLRQPSWVKRPSQRTGGQKGGAIALALFFGKADHLNTKG